MFTLTISDKPVAVTNADEGEARELFMSDAFKEDLKTLESEGAPLWDGFSSLNVRPSTEDEIAEFQDADFDEDDEDDEGPYIVFLVDVNDFDDEDDE